jgi:Protein of unknown function (DUF1566)
VRDNLTGLIWLKQANCFGSLTWAPALNAANTLASGMCGLTDGSQPGDWRLPNIKELRSLIGFGFVNPALPNTAGTAQWTEGDPFVNVPMAVIFYWSSSAFAAAPYRAWILSLTYGLSVHADKINVLGVWPVRGGQP